MPSARIRSADVGQRAANDLFVGPGGMIHQGGRAVRPIMLGQHPGQLRDAVGREEDAQRGPRLGQPRKILRRRHRRAAGRAGEDDRLGDFRGGQLHPQRGGRRLKRADARHHFVVDPQPVQGVHLLADRAVDGRLAGVQAHHVDLARAGPSGTGRRSRPGSSRPNRGARPRPEAARSNSGLTSEPA